MPIMHALHHRHSLLYTSNLLGLRTCRPHLVVNDASPDVSRSIDASPVVSRSISSDCRAAPSSVGTSGGSIGGAARWRHTSLQHWHCTVSQAGSGWIWH